MPILTCIAISAIIYILLFYSLKDTKPREDKAAAIAIEKCSKCQKPFYSNWRFCPYCGNTKEKG